MLQPTPLLGQFLRALRLSLGWGLCVLSSLVAQDIVTPQPMKPAVTEFKEAMPAAPESGIMDLAELFSTEEKKALVAKIKQFREAENFYVYVAAYTFVYGEDSNQRAERLSGKWLSGRQGAVVVYDKGGTGSPAVIGMAWRQDDARELPNRTIKGILMSAKEASEAPTEATSSQRLQAAVMEIMNGYARVRPILEENQRALRVAQWKILAGVLGFMLASLGILSFTQRYQKKLATREAESYLFPHAEIAARYGAPYGGGVVVQMHYGGKSE